jgi:hypothetical protein
MVGKKSGKALRDEGRLILLLHYDPFAITGQKSI